jgi:hypothetical protein
MNGSRLAATNSIRKAEKGQLPSITLEMEMKAVKYLKEKGHLNLSSMEPVPLFSDPLRNGTLLSRILGEELGLDPKPHWHPRNILDCRENFKAAFAQMRTARIGLPLGFEQHYENIIKG